MESQRRPLNRCDEGAALLLVMMVVLALSGLAFAAVSLADLEGAASANDARALAVSYAAEAAIERAIDDLAAATNWSDVLTGAVSSPLRDIDPRPRAPWADVLDIGAMTAEVQRDADVGVGPDQTRWRVFLAGPLAAMLPDTPPGVLPYLVAWVGDDRADGDGNALADANQVVRVRARALGPRGVRSDREAVLERLASTGVVRVRSRWEPR
ncbi:MAG: hypothetical protein ABI634_16470 [Acidobacteriota bacterium]